MKNNNKYWNIIKKAFTLVELIIVISILAILWTIAFFAMQWYSRDTRNSVRLADLSKINKTLGMKISEIWKVLIPDEFVNISASWTNIIYQWIAWEKVLPALWMSNWWKDPKNNKYYSYSTNTTLTKYQLIWFLEWDPIANMTNKIYAAEDDISERNIKVFWDELWILLSPTTNQPITSWVDLLNSTDDYKAVFSDGIIEQWLWKDLFTYFYNRNYKLLSNRNIANFDKNLVLFFDMSTTTQSGSSILIKDFSSYWNNWICKNNWVIENCWSSINWPILEKWWYMSFPWYKDYILVPNNDSINIDNISIIMKIKTKQQWLYDILWKYRSIYHEWYLLRISDTKIRSSIWTPDTNLIYENWKITYWLWYIISNTYDWENNTIYIDSSWYEKKYSTIANILNSVRDLCIPDYRFWNSFYWYIDEVRIYNRALSQSEIKTIYETLK